MANTSRLLAKIKERMTQFKMHFKCKRTTMTNRLEPLKGKKSSYLGALKLARVFCNMAYFRSDSINIKLQAPELKSSHEKWKTLILCSGQLMV